MSFPVCWPHTVRPMISLLVWFWYCYDDALAALIGVTGVGEVHILIWILLLILTSGGD